MATNKNVDNELRSLYLEKIIKLFSDNEEEVLITASNSIAIPVVDSTGMEKWIQVTVKVPTGTHGGEEFDGYELAQDYQMKQKEKAAKAAEAERKKTEKIKKDKAARAAKAEKKKKGEEKTE